MQFSSREKHMPANQKIPGGIDPSDFLYPNEHMQNLRDLLAAARDDLRPRNFAERHLVEQMALCKWRQHRVLCMERAVCEHEFLEFETTEEKDPDGQLIEPLDDYYFIAQLHSPERHSAVLAALSRLEARYHRQFCSSLRLLNTLRRNPDFNPAPTQKPTQKRTSQNANAN